MLQGSINSLTCAMVLAIAMACEISMSVRSNADLDRESRSGLHGSRPMRGERRGASGASQASVTGMGQEIGCQRLCRPNQPSWPVLAEQVERTIQQPVRYRRFGTRRRERFKISNWCLSGTDSARTDRRPPSRSRRIEVARTWTNGSPGAGPNGLLPVTAYRQPCG